MRSESGANHGDSARIGFQQALQNLGNVAFVYGGGCFYCNGVNVTGGTARFAASRTFG